MSGRRAAATATSPWWAWLVCYLRDHHWLHDGPGTWAVTCSRCGRHYRVSEVRW